MSSRRGCRSEDFWGVKGEFDLWFAVWWGGGVVEMGCGGGGGRCGMSGWNVGGV